MKIILITLLSLPLLLLFNCSNKLLVRTSCIDKIEILQNSDSLILKTFLSNDEKKDILRKIQNNISEPIKFYPKYAVKVYCQKECTIYYINGTALKTEGGKTYRLREKIIE